MTMIRAGINFLFICVCRIDVCIGFVHFLDFCIGCNVEWWKGAAKEKEKERNSRLINFHWYDLKKKYLKKTIFRRAIDGLRIKNHILKKYDISRIFKNKNIKYPILWKFCEKCLIETTKKTKILNIELVFFKSVSKHFKSS